MGTKAHVPFDQKQRQLVEKLLRNKDILGDSGADIVQDIHSRNPETLSAKQVKMLTEMGDRVDATLKSRKQKEGAGAGA